MTYKEQLAHPKWQKKRLEILVRDNWTCQICLDTETQLQVHHKCYDSQYKKKAWEYPEHIYTTLCADCHRELTEHIKEHNDDKEFDVLRINHSDGSEDSLFIYSKGILKISKMINGIKEQTTHKLVQFLINNWLKNG